ncbi:MAG: LacI family transcriptional regulator [Clostridiaceae bacterium]|nr:LacI family transcriptional regulator [Clostridiaceae bacterium]
MVTLFDIAQIAGVSCSTVSRALGDFKGTNADVRKRIHKIAKELGYDRNGLARSLVTRQTKTIGLLLPDLTNPFFIAILSAMETIANEAGYSVLISCSFWDQKTEQEELNVLLESRVDGIFFYPCARLEKGKVANIRVPLVVSGQQSSRFPEISFVNIDHHRSLVLSVHHLVECGYKKIAYFGGNAHSPTAHVRLNAFKDAVRNQKMPMSDIEISEGEYSIKSGYDRGLNTLDSKSPPDGIICGDDLIALGVMQAASELGITVPDDLGIIGYDDVLYAALPQIMLTTIRVPCEEIGSVGMKLLLRLMSGTKKKLGMQVLLFPELVIRNTTSLNHIDISNE